MDRFRATTGLPVSTYSSALKLRWILDTGRPTTPADLPFGTVDTWLIWHLTGGVDGGVHVTDVTNASRTMLMDLATCEWDEAILDELGIPRSMLPEIRGSSEVYGTIRASTTSPACRSPAMLGDQHAALFGQTCFEAGQAKCTYGTGAFMLMHTGHAGRQHARADHDGRGTARWPGDADDVRARGLGRRRGLAHPVAARRPRASSIAPTRSRRSPVPCRTRAIS